MRVQPSKSNTALKPVNRSLSTVFAAVYDDCHDLFAADVSF